MELRRDREEPPHATVGVLVVEVVARREEVDRELEPEDADREALGAEDVQPSRAAEERPLRAVGAIPRGLGRDEVAPWAALLVVGAVRGGLVLVDVLGLFLRGADVVLDAGRPSVGRPSVGLLFVELVLPVVVEPLLRRSADGDREKNDRQGQRGGSSRKAAHRRAESTPRVGLR